MPKTITLRLKDDDYQLFKNLADKDNRPISNYIETAVKKFIEISNNNKREPEADEIKNNQFDKNLKKRISIVKQNDGNMDG